MKWESWSGVAAFCAGAVAGSLAGWFSPTMVTAVTIAVVAGAVVGAAVKVGFRFFDRRHQERGSAVLEYMLGMGLMVLPMTFLLTTTAWPSRLNAASAAAFQAAKAVAEAPDPASGEDLGRQRAAEVLANHGFDPASATVTYSTPDPGRSAEVTATVHIDLPALRFPALGSWNAVSWSRSATVQVPSYRSLR